MSYPRELRFNGVLGSSLVVGKVRTALRKHEERGDTGGFRYRVRREDHKCFHGSGAQEDEASRREARESPTSAGGRQSRAAGRSLRGVQPVSGRIGGLP